MSKLNGLGKTHREPFGSRTIKAVQENSYKFNRNKAGMLLFIYIFLLAAK